MTAQNGQNFWLPASERLWNDVKSILNTSLAVIPEAARGYPGSQQAPA